MFRPARYAFLLFFVFAVVLLPASDPTRAQTGESDTLPVWSPDGSQIAFVSDRSGTYDLWMMNADGSDPTSLFTITRTALNWNPKPTWSPDGQYVALSSDRSGDHDIWLIAVDGPTTLNITQTTDTSEFEFCLFPDNERLAYVSVGPDRRSTIQVMQLDGAQHVDLTPEGHYSFFDLACSPDGTNITFGALGLDTFEPAGIWIGSLETRESTPLTLERLDQNPQWAPNGHTILLYNQNVMYRDDWGLWTVETDGSDLRNLTGPIEGIGTSALWSPDGEQIVFHAIQDVLSDIWVVDADGSNVRNLTAAMQGMNILPRWSPDGAKIAFASNTAGSFDIWVMNADGSDPVNLTGAH